MVLSLIYLALFSANDSPLAKVAVYGLNTLFAIAFAGGAWAVVYDAYLRTADDRGRANIWLFFRNQFKWNLVITAVSITLTYLLWQLYESNFPRAVTLVGLIFVVWLSPLLYLRIKYSAYHPVPRSDRRTIFGRPQKQPGKRKTR